MTPLDSRKPAKYARGFSLIEVVIAIGICAVTVVSVVALYGPTQQAVSDARQAQDAAQVIGAVQTELQHLPFATVSSYLAGGDVLYANPTGSRIGPYLAPVWSDLGASQRERDREKFFEIALIRNEAFGPVAGALIFTLRLRWPAYNGDGLRLTDETQQKILLVPAAVAR